MPERRHGIGFFAWSLMSQTATVFMEISSVEVMLTPLSGFDIVFSMAEYKGEKTPRRDPVNQTV